MFPSGPFSHSKARNYKHNKRQRGHQGFTAFLRSRKKMGFSASKDWSDIGEEARGMFSMEGRFDRQGLEEEYQECPCVSVGRLFSIRISISWLY